jgi:hypothetical protein
MMRTGLITDQQTHQPIRLHADYGEGDTVDYSLALISYREGSPALVVIPDDEEYPLEPISINLSEYGFPSAETVFWMDPDVPTLAKALLETNHAKPEDRLPVAHYGSGGRETSTALRLTHIELPGEEQSFDLDEYYGTTLPKLQQ